MIWLLSLLLAIIIVAIARVLSSPPEMKMSRQWQRGDYYRHERITRSQWDSYWS